MLEDLRKVHSSFIDNIWGADLADMQLLLSKFNKGIRFLLCVIDIYSKYDWVIPLKYKNGIIITNAFQKILDESNANQIKYGYRKPVNFTIDQLNNGYKRCIQHIIKEKLLLLKDLLEL